MVALCRLTTVLIRLGIACESESDIDAYQDDLGSSGRHLTASIEYHSGRQEHPHPFIHILDPSREFSTEGSLLPTPQPSNASCAFLIPLNPELTRSERMQLSVDMMLIETLIAKHAERLGFALVAELQTLCEVLARGLCCTLAEALKGKSTSARSERLRSDKSEMRRSSAGGAILVLGLAMLSTPLLEAG